jgi:hypothetical protein
MKLTPGEERQALVIAKQVAQHPDTNDPIAEHHLGEAQAIVLVLRSEHRDDLLLLEQARLKKCREQGTHYGVTFIKQVYEMAKQGRRKK